MDQVLKAKTEVALSRASFKLMRDHPFFGSILLTMPTVITDALPFKTMGVDGKKLYVDPDFVSKHSTAVLMGVLAHEAMHVVYKHHLRRGARCAKKWNVATDYAINLVVKECRLDLPSSVLCDTKYEGMSAEKIYDMLDDKEIEALYGDAANSTGIVIDLKDLSPAEREEVEKAVERAVRQAAQTAKAAGKLPKALEELVGAEFDHVISWQERLRHVVGGLGHDDYTWRRPNRRALGAYGALLPSMVGLSCGPIVVAVDTSGSISSEDASAYLSEINGIIRECRPESVTVIQCDAEVQHVDEIEEEIPELVIHGRGGTDFNPPFAWLEERAIIPQAFIYMTDMYGPFPEDPGFPVVWLATSDVEGPFGETIRLEA